MIRRVEKNKHADSMNWVCKDRRKGKNGNGCKNLIIPEEELLEALSEALRLTWNGADCVNEADFEKLKSVKIFEEGRIEVEFCEEQKTA